MEKKIHLAAKGSISEYQHFAILRKLRNSEASRPPSFTSNRDQVDKTHS